MPLANVAVRTRRGRILLAVQVVGFPENSGVRSLTYDGNQHKVNDPDRRVAPKAKPDGNPTQSDTIRHFSGPSFVFVHAYLFVMQ